MPKPEWHPFAVLTPDQQAQFERAKNGLRGEMNLYGREGTAPPLLLEAVADCAAELIATQLGPEHIAQWFRAKAKHYGAIAAELPPTCKFCGEPFERRPGFRAVCSDDCRNALVVQGRRGN